MTEAGAPGAPLALAPVWDSGSDLEPVTVHGLTEANPVQDLPQRASPVVHVVHVVNSSYYSSAEIKCPVNFQPPYLAPILSEISVQHHFRTLLSIFFPMVPNFAWFDEKKVEFDQV